MNNSGDAQPSLDENPLDALAEEFVARYRAGQRPEISEYIARRPELAAEIRELFPTLVMMEVARPSEGPVADILVKGSGEAGGPRLERLGDYRILREVGRGGMGIVYEAEQESLGRRVALKVLPRRAMLDLRQLERFHREAKAAARLHHTNIVPVFGVGEHDGLHYHVMQFIQGLGLDEVLVEVGRLRDVKQSGATSIAFGARKTPPSAVRAAEALISGQFQRAAVLPPAPAEPLPGSDPSATCRPSAASSASEIHLPGQDAKTMESGAAYWNSIARIGVQVAEALAYANSQGVLHRDIKPSNLLLDFDGTVWVTDFGLAKASGSDDLTHTGDVVGTLRYMAPERFHGLSDQQSDIYSLGITLYELLTLRPPFAESDRHKLIRQIAQEEPPRPRSLDRALPRDLETIVLKAIAKQPGDRYRSAESLATDLRSFLDDKPILARRISRYERAWRWRRRNPIVAGLAAAVALLACLLAVGALLMHIVRSERDRAVINLDRAVVAEKRAQQSKKRAEEAEREIKIRSHLAQAAAERYGGLPGRRTKALNEITKAVNLGPSEKLKGALRDEAIAALATIDLRAVDAFVASAAPPPNFDESYRWYAFLDDEAKIHVRRAGHANDLDLYVLPGIGRQDVEISFSPGAKYLMVHASEGGVTQVWRIESGQSLFPSPLTNSGRPSVSADESRLAIGLANGSTAIFALPSGSELHRVPSERAPQVVALSPDGRRLAAASWDPPLVRIWDLNRAAVALELTSFEALIHSVCWDREGRRIAIALATPANRAEVWDVDTGTQLATMDGHSQNVVVANFHHSGMFLVTGSWDGFTRVWDVSSARELITWPTGMSGAPSRDGNILGHVWRHERMQHIELVAQKEYQTLVSGLGAGQGEYRDGGISPDGRLLALGMDDGVRIWDLASCREIAWLPTGKTPSVRFSPTGIELIASGESGLLRWPVTVTASSSSESHQIRVGPPRLVSLPVVPADSHGTADGRTLAFCSVQSDHGLILDLATETIQATVGPHSRMDRIVLSPDGRWAATTGWFSKTVHVWDARTAAPVQELHLSAQPTATFSPDSQRLILSTGDEFGFWKVGSWEKIKTLPREHCPYPGMVAFSPDGRVMALELSSAIISFLDFETCRPLARFEDPHRDRPGWMSFTPDGQRLVAVSHYGRAIHVWDLHSIRRQLAKIGLDWDASTLRERDEHAANGPPRTTLALGEIGSRAEAERIAKQAMDQFERAQVHARSKRWPEAVVASKRAVEISPENATLHNSLAWLLATCPDDRYRDGALATQHARRAVDLAPEDLAAWNTLGVAYYRKGEWRQAIDALTKAENLKPGEYFGHNAFFLAMAHWRLNDSEAARSWCSRAIDWMERNEQNESEELRRFRAEAEQLLATGQALPL